MGKYKELSTILSLRKIYALKPTRITLDSLEMYFSNTNSSEIKTSQKRFW